MRTQVFKDYVLSRAAERGNPYSFEKIKDIPRYVRRALPSNWTYPNILIRGVNITPAEVLTSKVVQAMFA